LHFGFAIPTKEIDAMSLPESGPSCKAARAHRATLPEPVEVDSFWRNRRHEAVVSTLSTYEGRNIFDVRVHTMQNGKLVPTKKGVAIVVLRLPELAAAITKALAKAVELGLLDQNETAG
jgi:hypothetical protein